MHMFFCFFWFFSPQTRKGYKKIPSPCCAQIKKAAVKHKNNIVNASGIYNIICNYTHVCSSSILHPQWLIFCPISVHYF